VEQGDSLIVHSSYRRLGKVDGGPAAVTEALLAAIGRGKLSARQVINRIFPELRKPQKGKGEKEDKKSNIGWKTSNYKASCGY
jgi:(p)ppGpp synthase/HD superfamily hydrolase